MRKDAKGREKDTVIREFTLDDYDAVYALWQNAGPGIGLGFADTREAIAKKLLRDPDLFLVAVDDDSHPERSRRIIGTVIGGFDGRRGLIYHLAVEHAYRKRGIGRMLMAEVEQRLKAKGCQRCYLLVKHDAQDVIEFYRKSGWDTSDVTIMGKTLGKR
ncbi:MAG: GNAT family N-acetyltransferase [Chloroflexi bacterium]|nr:GNAT family N-acetyltransferase [Chloroflexota bacterium]